MDMDGGTNTSEYRPNKGDIVVYKDVCYYYQSNGTVGYLYNHREEIGNKKFYVASVRRNKLRKPTDEEIEEFKSRSIPYYELEKPEDNSEITHQIKDPVKIYLGSVMVYGCFLNADNFVSAKEHALGRPLINALHRAGGAVTPGHLMAIFKKKNPKKLMTSILNNFFDVYRSKKHCKFEDYIILKITMACNGTVYQFEERIEANFLNNAG